MKKRVYVAGHRGMVGSSVLEVLKKHGHDVFGFTSDELDLTQQTSVEAMMQQERPQWVVVSAAKVGGIGANSRYPADFIYRNLMIEANLIHAAWQTGVQRLVFLGSSCIYPRDCVQPMREEHLLSQSLEPTNRPYAVAKIAGVELCASYNRQHGTRFLAAMPTNLYGPGDNYDLNNSHVIPAILRKMHEAKVKGQQEVTLWGSGKALREFLYCKDLAEAMVFLLELPENTYDSLCAPDMASWPLLNVGSGQEVSIADLASLIAQVTEFTGKVLWSSSQPDGTPRKLLDCSKMQALGWQAHTQLLDGLQSAYKAFQETEIASCC